MKKLNLVTEAVSRTAETVVEGVRVVAETLDAYAANPSDLGGDVLFAVYATLDALQKRIGRRLKAVRPFFELAIRERGERTETGSWRARFSLGQALLIPSQRITWQPKKLRAVLKAAGVDPNDVIKRETVEKVDAKALQRLIDAGKVSAEAVSEAATVKEYTKIQLTLDAELDGLDK